MATFTYSNSTGRYRDNETGRFLGRIELRKALDDIVDESSQMMKELSIELVEREISLAQWQTDMFEEIQNLHITFGVAANGGYGNMTPEKWSRLEEYIQSQRTYLQEFAEEIYTGEQSINGINNRSTLYAEAARVSYENERRIVETSRGVTEEINIIGSADHCDDCSSMASLGWQPIGTLIPVGSRICRVRCRCSINYRKNDKDKLGSQVESF